MDYHEWDYLSLPWQLDLLNCATHTHVMYSESYTHTPCTCTWYRGMNIVSSLVGKGGRGVLRGGYQSHQVDINGGCSTFHVCCVQLITKDSIVDWWWYRILWVLNVVVVPGVSQLPRGVIVVPGLS